jgi:hypothetical protein
MDIYKEIKEMAAYINEDSIKVRHETCKLAKEFENAFTNPPFLIDINNMDQRYIKNDVMYILNDFQSEEGYKQIAATGAVPVDNKIKAKLVLLEQMYPIISNTYKKLKYVDEVWYLDKQSVVGGNTRLDIHDRVPPGFDIGGEYELGERPYSRFGIIGPEQNPQRKFKWSPNALIEIFDEFVISAQAPVYVRDEFIGKISIHYNLIFLRNDTIKKSDKNLILLTNQFTIVGMSPSAKVITKYLEYDKKKWDSKKAKMEYVDNELNLVNHNKQFVDKLLNLTPGDYFEYEFSGRTYKIIKENIPEVGFQIVALV